MNSETQSSSKALFDIGSLIDGKWVLIERVGKGGMGEVFRAHQLNLNRDVAIKVISREILEDAEENPEEFARAMARLEREVQIMAKVRHPNVLQIYDYGTVTSQKEGVDEQMQYIAMEYIPGNTLRFTMSKEGFDIETELLLDWIQRYFQPVLDGLEAIHAIGIVHRDVKPENILMDDETPKITDFGLSRSPRMKAVSNSWDVKGTISYMAPEQFADFRKAGFAADIYSLGKILYEAVCGKMDPKMLPFKQAILENPETDFLKCLDTIIRKATDENPKQRYQNIAEFRQAIMGALSSGTLGKKDAIQSLTEAPVRARLLWVGIIAVLVSLGAMTIYHIIDNVDRNNITLNKQTKEKDGKVIFENPAELTSSWVGTDGRQMNLINATETHQAFYVDRSLVTFHHYVEFLNEMTDKLEVTDGIVRYKEDIWIYLGDGSDPADQVAFQNAHFYLREAEWAPKPVVRVTWLGAHAYARHYDKRLPTYEEWKSLNREWDIAHKTELSSIDNQNDSMHSHMIDNPLNGNNELIKQNYQKDVFKEWLDTKSDSTTTSGVVDWSTENYGLVKRYPWEGLYDVGFRTAMDIQINSSSIQNK
ncbi:MAG: protein kinase [Proteobacteria bacterium]|nr:protein kinase [Pseudomonadota bacterium]MBU4470590.1 protein kinase [Pseudomonadota bacterium]MCG2751425.1 bifunctional serine/threonine-protein kinase/formylglycine-generating enzyme family protein [Desulfobacteraceae bacterium]